jgi:c-di-GMP-binding flagellar brake protein YcgR
MPDKSADILEKAIARSVSTVLSLPSAGTFRDHKSRFICSIPDGILVEAPDNDRALINELARTKTPCGVSFKSGMFKVSFESPIRRIEPNWKLNEHVSVNALLLEYPADVKVTQKRSDYRVEIGAGTDISVRIWRLAPNEDLHESPADTKEVAAQILNLSNGGIGVKFIGEDGKRPKVCTQDRLRVALTFEGEEVIIEGRMRPPHLRPTSSTMVTGIQFGQSECNPKEKTGSRLLRIFVELQRRELRRVKLGLKNSA